MSLTGENLEQISQLVDTAQSILVLLPAKATTDEVAAALAWAGTLRSKGKDVQLVAPELPELEAELPGVEDISSELGKQNLVVSFAYVAEQVDKVSYHIGEETNRFYLTIRPKKGFAPLSQESLEIAYAGAEADLLVYIGVGDLEDLQPLSGEYSEFFRDTPSVVVAAGETTFGTVKIQTSSAAGLSEESAQLFVQLGWEFDGAVATLLLRGIEETTDGMTSLSTTPDTYETVAVLLRAGARRNRRRVSVPSEQNLPAKKHQSGNQRAQTAQPSLVEAEPESETVPTAPAQSPAPTITKAVPHTFADVLNRGAQPDEELSITQLDSVQHDLSPTAAPGRYLGRKRQRSVQG